MAPTAIAEALDVLEERVGELDSTRVLHRWRLISSTCIRLQNDSTAASW